MEWGNFSKYHHRISALRNRPVENFKACKAGNLISFSHVLIGTFHFQPRCGYISTQFIHSRIRRNLIFEEIKLVAVSRLYNMKRIGISIWQWTKCETVACEGLVRKRCTCIYCYFLPLTALRRFSRIFINCRKIIFACVQHFTTRRVLKLINFRLANTGIGVQKVDSIFLVAPCTTCFSARSENGTEIIDATIFSWIISLANAIVMIARYWRLKWSIEISCRRI